MLNDGRLPGHVSCPPSGLVCHPGFERLVLRKNTSVGLLLFVQRRHINDATLHVLPWSIRPSKKGSITSPFLQGGVIDINTPNTLRITYLHKLFNKSNHSNQAAPALSHRLLICIGSLRRS